MQVAQNTTVTVEVRTPPSLRLVPSYATFESTSTLLPKYTGNAAPRTSQETLIEPLSPSSITSTVYAVSSLLGPIHYADPATASTAVKVLCKWFPNSLFAKKLEDAKKSGEKQVKKPKKEEKVLSEKEQLELEEKRAAIIEADRILDYNLKLLGI